KPPFFRPAEIDHQTERFARMTPEERLQIFVELCDLTDSIQRNRPDRGALRQSTPRSAEAEALWKRLMAEYRGHD
ncbi:MAG: hypothetical protein ACOC5B_02735, partial [Myxococcota bacterium]